MDNTIPANPTPNSSPPPQPEKSYPETPLPTHMSRKTLLLIMLLGAITLFLSILALHPQTENTMKKSSQTSQMATSPSPTPTPFAQSVLSFVPSKTITPIPGKLTYDVITDSSINTINAIQLE